MRSMATEALLLKRRTLLGAAGAAMLGSALVQRAAAALPARACAHLVSAARIGGVDRAAILDGDSLSDFALPGRAHAALFLPRSREVLLVARRPGRFAAFVDPTRAPDAMRFIAPVPRHRFAGHAALRDDGAIVTAELHEDNAAAIAVLRDGTSGAVRAVWPLGGIEPHDLVFAGDRLIVALGGIERAAAVKGPALNAGHIESAIVELDARDGRVLQRHGLPEALGSLSMRHLALAPDGQSVAFGIQDQDRSQLRPLAGVLETAKGLQLFGLPTDDPGALRFYVGSVAIDATGMFLATTSPKGGFVALWSLATGAYAGGVALTDVCGLAADESSGFWASSGMGDVVHIAVGAEGPAIDALWQAEVRFDNHLLRL
jgi:hypothetical protein